VWSHRAQLVVDFQPCVSPRDTRNRPSHTPRVALTLPLERGHADDLLGPPSAPLVSPQLLGGYTSLGHSNLKPDHRSFERCLFLPISAGVILCRPFLSGLPPPNGRTSRPSRIFVGTKSWCLTFHPVPAPINTRFLKYVGKVFF